MAKRKTPQALVRKRPNGQTIELEMDSAGVEAYLRSRDVGDLCEEAAQSLVRVATGMAGRKAEWAIKRFQGRDRVRVHVATGNVEAMLAEAQDRVLTRAVGLTTTSRRPS